MKNNLDTAGIVYLYPTSFLPEVNDMSKQIPIVNIGDKNDEITFDSIRVSNSKPADLVAGSFDLPWTPQDHLHINTDQ